jgi:hypothetical protein
VNFIGRLLGRIGIDAPLLLVDQGAEGSNWRLEIRPVFPESEGATSRAPATELAEIANIARQVDLLEPILTSSFFRPIAMANAWRMHVHGRYRRTPRKYRGYQETCARDTDRCSARNAS